MQFARHWQWFAIPFLIALGLALDYGALSDRFETPNSVVVTLDIIVGLLLAETLLAFVTRRHGVPVLAAPGQTEDNRLSPFVMRVPRVTVLVAAAAAPIRNWAVDMLGLADES